MEKEKTYTNVLDMVRDITDDKFVERLEEEIKASEISKKLLSMRCENNLTLKSMAEKVAKVLKGNWSVDFACDVSGAWWLIDMATALHSWHPDCNSSAQFLH